ncbi:hypothetical protein [Streptomyces sp. 3N207]|uniref:hypothetical protein n=1 Tax=Streptomyces sp. 3N207 TaxID=3457417 RepID=UPI003FD568E1
MLIPEGLFAESEDRTEDDFRIEVKVIESVETFDGPLSPTGTSGGPSWCNCF